MRGRIAKYLAVAAVLGLLVAGMVVWQRAFPQAPAAPSADVAHCAVYRGLFEHVGGGESGVFFKSTTQALSADPRRMKEVIEAADGWRPRKYDDHAAVVRVPKRFDRVVAGSDAARTPWDHWPKRGSVRQTFDLDTSPYFQPVKNTNRVSIRPCFDAGPVRGEVPRRRVGEPQPARENTRVGRPPRCGRAQRLAGRPVCERAPRTGLQ